jgi:hypothetical protein
MINRTREPLKLRSLNTITDRKRIINYDRRLSPQHTIEIRSRSTNELIVEPARAAAGFYHAINCKSGPAAVGLISEYATCSVSTARVNRPIIISSLYHDRF